MMKHQTFMQRALQLAASGRGCVEPNPMVGAVLVRDDAVIGEGYHRALGLPHAEVEAIADCRSRGNDPAGCTVYVTLEPCSHHGKQPPCVEALVAAGIGRVFAAMVDPFDQVAGRGIAALRQAGIEVEVGLCEEAARELNGPFIKRVTRGLPWVIAKWAQTLDGRIATSTGHSRWISGEQSRRVVHEMRSGVDAVMVGIGTVVADDPQLTARDVTVRRAAMRVVIDPSLRIDPGAKLLQAANNKPQVDPPVMIAVRSDVLDRRGEKLRALEGRGVSFIALPVENVLKHLAEQHDATNVLVEGGAVLIGSMLGDGLIDQVLAFIAPKVLGDGHARAAAEGLDRSTIDEATGLRLVAMQRLGDDVLLDYRVAGERD